MSSSFGPRRKARIIGQVEDGVDSRSESHDVGSAVKRPSKPKHRSRISFGPGETSMVDNEDDGSTIITPKRGLVRRAIGNSASKDATPTSSATADQFNTSEAGEIERPSYSKEHLEALRKAQRSKPTESDTTPASTSESREVDVVAKFGRDISRYQQGEQQTSIPTDAEIQEKKARRSRLAQLSKFNINQDGSGEDDDVDDRPNSDEDEFLTNRDKISLRDARATTKEDDTRLIHDDEDIMEGFDDFTNENGRIAIGNRAREDAKIRQRAEMQEMIDAAQDVEEDESDSDLDHRAEYEEVQARKGFESLHMNGNGTKTDDGGARTPPKITPIPSLSECIEKLRGTLLDLESSRSAKLQRLEELATERQDIAKREVEIQNLLKETSAKYEKLSAEAGGVNVGLIENSTPTLPAE